MQFGVLGPVATWHEGRELAITSGRQRCVLALLLLEAGRVVSLDRMIDVLWEPGSAPRTARNVVQQCVSELRKLLAVDPGVRLSLKAPGYVLEVDRQRVDVHRFRSLVADAHVEDSADGRAAGLRAALGLWRGEPLAGADATGLAPIRHALAEERVTVLEECLAAEVESGGHAEAVPQLTALAAEHPLRERPAGLLMLALYRGGRAAEALEHYHHTRRRLGEELGTDPGPALRELHQRILTADPTLTTTAPTPPQGTGTTAVPRQLPAAPAPFIGRHCELDRLDTALESWDRTATVVISALAGAGGIGKTWLALHWAHRHAEQFPDGQLFVDLRGFSPDSQPLDPAVAVRGFLDALGVDPGRMPADLDAQAALYRSLIAGKRMLVVLDNAATADQVVPLLPGTSTCTVLITGRTTLALLIDRHGARHLQLGTLTHEEAHALLAGRIGDGRVAAEPVAARELIDLCGRYPLALSIMARYTSTRPHVPLAEFTAELRELGLDMFDNDDPAVSLPAVLSWSLRGLTAEQRTVFALLGIAPGPDIGLPAAISLTGMPEARTRKALLALEDASLIDRHVHGRYAMHDLIRRHATNTARDDLPEPIRLGALERVVDFYLHTAHTADGHLAAHREPIRLDPPAPSVRIYPFPSTPMALAWFATEYECLLAAQRTAVAQQRHQIVWGLAWSLSTFQFRRGYFHDQLAVWRAGLAAAERLPDVTTRALAHRRLGSACTELRLHDKAVEHLRQALILAESLHDPVQQIRAHWTLAAMWEQNEDHRSVEHATRALLLCKNLDDRVWEARGLNVLGWCSARLGHHDPARAHCHAALALYRRLGAREGEADVLDSLGYIGHHTGHHLQAIRYYQQALTLYRDLGDTRQTAISLDRFGQSHAMLGQAQEARAAWREAIELYREQGRDTDAQRVQQQLDDLDTNH